MKAYVFSIGETTTNLCCQLMREMGFEVILFNDDTTLWDKLKRFYSEALKTPDNTFIRIDADIIPNKNVLKMVDFHKGSPKMWTCAVGYDWYKQDRGAISIHVMDRHIIKKCLKEISSARTQIRPETHLWRLPDVNPTTQLYQTHSCGIHGYGQKDHRERIKQLKYARDQQYDWELVEKIERLGK